MREEEKKRNRAAAFLAAHGEKLGLAVAASALVAYVVFGPLLAAGDAEGTREDHRVQILRTELAATHHDAHPGAPLAMPASHDVTAGEPAKDTDVSYWTEAVVRPGPPVREEPKLAFRPVRTGQPAVSLEAATISWTVDHLPPDAVEIKIAKFIIQRDGREIATVAGSVTSYCDASVAPRTQYSYAVIPVAADGLTADPAGPVRVTTPSDYRIALKGFLDGKMMFEVERTAGGGAVTKKVVLAGVGEKIGDTGCAVASVREPSPERRRSACGVCRATEVRYVDDRGAGTLLRHPAAAEGLCA